MDNSENTNEPKRQETYLLTCAPNEDLKSACASAQFDQSLRVRMKKLCILGIQNAPSEYSDQTARMCKLIRIFAKRRGPRVRFLTLRLI